MPQLEGFPAVTTLVPVEVLAARGRTRGPGQLRLLYLSAELVPGDARGYRQALSGLRFAGLIEDVRVISPMARKTADRHPLNDEMSSIIDFSPNVVLIEHPRDGMVLSEQIARLRSKLQFTLIVDEGDIYDPWAKRPPRLLRELAPLADLIATPGAGRQRRSFERMGARRVEWLPSSFNPGDFGRRPIPLNRDLDVVMIANDTRSRLPFGSMPGSVARSKLVTLMEKRFGSRFSVYGKGWSGPSAKGPIRFVGQEELLQRAMISVNFDHYPRERQFFSNRLPIALASGSVHLTTRHPGFSQIFPEEVTKNFLHLLPDPERIVRRVESLLERLSPEEVQLSGEAARRFAFERFRQDDRLVDLLNFAQPAERAISKDASREAWSLDVDPIHEY